MELPRKKALKRELSGMGLVYLLTVVAVIVGFFFRVQVADLIDIRTGDAIEEPMPPYPQRLGR
jgi:hypothetical protein